MIVAWGLWLGEGDSGVTRRRREWGGGGGGGRNKQGI